MAAISDEIIERVKAEASIVDVVSDYVRLRRTGKNWIGLCPFHDDKRPSFTVEPVRGIYKCFACGKGGNVFTFLMELNSWTFPETVRSLVESLGIEITESPKEQKDYSDRERLAAIIRDTGRFFYQTLKSHSGEPAQAYFKVRGFTDETIRRFGLGYSPDSWEGLLNFLKEKGYGEQEIERAGLILKREGRSSHYDRFRGRAMFPVFTPTGRAVGFGARRLNEDPDQPKYINSPETPIYQKSRLLYGLFQAKDAVRKSGRALVVEGYADVISLHQAGVESAIATCGTAMAKEHADLISRYCSRIVLVFDSDKAGEAATERGIEVLLRQALDVSVLRLPDGEDPDTFVRKFGAKEFEKRIEESVSFLEFRARTLKHSGDLDSPDRSAEAIRSLVTTIAMIPDELKRELYIQKIAQNYYIPESLLLQELARAVGRETSRRKRPIPVKDPPPKVPVAEETSAIPPPPFVGKEEKEIHFDVPAPPVPQILRKPVTRNEFAPSELGLLTVLLQGDPQMLEHVFARIEPEDFSNPLTRELVSLILGHYVNQRSFTLEDLAMEELSPDIRDLVTLLSVERESISSFWVTFDPYMAEPNPWQIARDCLIKIEQEKIERESRQIQETLSDPELDPAKQTEALARFKELRERREELNTLITG